MTELNLKCAECGSPLKGFTHGDGSITVTPCENCLKDAAGQGYGDGHVVGYNRGYDKGFSEGSEYDLLPDIMDEPEVAVCGVG